MNAKNLLNLSVSCLSGWVLSTLLWLPPARAQVSIAPLIIETQTEQGQATGLFNVANSGNEPFRARLYAEPFTYNRDSGLETIKTNPHDLTPYLEFSPRELVVPPGTTRRVRMIARFPANIQPGEYRAVIFTEKLQDSTEAPKEGFRFNIISRIGTVVYVRHGEVGGKLGVDSASLNAQKNQIQLLIRNTGTASVRPKVVWSLKRGETTVKTGETDNTTVIAEGDRNILLSYPGADQPALVAGEYQLSGELVWNEIKGSKNETMRLPFTVNFSISATGKP